MQTSEYFSNAQLADMMHKAGIRPSVQRIAVLANIANLRKHPTADEIFTDLVTEFPSISRTTVYNSLHALVDSGLVRELEIESGTKHYDLAPQPSHSHFICKVCGKIFDMTLLPGLDNIAEPGFSIDCVDVFLKGICRECNQAGQLRDRKK